MEFSNGVKLNVPLFRLLSTFTIPTKNNHVFLRFIGLSFYSGHYRVPVLLKLNFVN